MSANVVSCYRVDANVVHCKGSKQTFNSNRDKEIRTMRKDQLDKNFVFYGHMILLLILVMLVVVSAVWGAEEIVIHGELTTEQREQGRLNWIARQEAMVRQNEAEIERRHELQIEVAKHQVALDLEAAGATQINVAAYASNSNDLRRAVNVENQNG